MVSAIATQECPCSKSAPGNTEMRGRNKQWAWRGAHTASACGACSRECTAALRPGLWRIQHLLSPAQWDFAIISFLPSQNFPCFFLALPSALEHMEPCFTSGDPKAKGCVDPVSTTLPCNFDQTYCHVCRRERPHPPPSSPPNIHSKEKKRQLDLLFANFFS